MSKLLSEVSDNVQVLTFNRPETKNAFDVELFELLRDSLNSAKDNSDIFSVIITGSNDVFSSPSHPYTQRIIECATLL